MEDIAPRIQNALERIEKAVTQALPKIDELHHQMKSECQISVSNPYIIG